ncbi:MAG TPA: trehalose-phosphatase [Myxococcota bacterium]|nr:trehalose-phosphatase [Myxococcota bacterium]
MMRNILARANRAVLEQFSWSNVLLAFDYDGTLAPIVSNPKRAPMRASTRELLKTLTRLYPVAVISGRARADAKRQIGEIPVQQVVGNHGLEPWHTSPRLSEEVARWLPLLADWFSTLKGVRIENKTFSVAIHYRHSREKRKVKAAISQAVEALGDLRVVGGKQVVNLLPIGAPHKGAALERERARLGCDTAIYVGDDETDEDVFLLQQPGRLLGIRVGRNRSSAATYCIPGQWAIDELLLALIASRRDARSQAAR